LQEAVNDLSPNVISVFGEDARSEEFIGAARDIEVGTEAFIYAGKASS
jgi:hypothetical protein